MAVPDDLLERMTTTFRATKTQFPDKIQADHSLLGVKLAEVAAQAPLYFGYHLPGWPFRMLVAKLLRRLVWPLLRRQYAFNLAVRDAFSEVLRQNEQDAARHDHALQRIIALEDEVAQLSTRMEMLSRQITREAQAAEAHPESGHTTNGVSVAAKTR